MFSSDFVSCAPASAMRYFGSAVLGAAFLFGCSSHESNASTEDGSRYALGSVVIDADGNRTTYVQTLPSLEGPFDNSRAIELASNGVMMPTSMIRRPCRCSLPPPWP